MNHNGYAGSAMPSTSLSIVGNSERSESKTMVNMDKKCFDSCKFVI